MTISILSLGWGVQSWTIAAMSALGDLPKPDYVVHADTTWERSSTYEFAKEQTKWLKEYGTEVITVSDREQAEKVTTSKSDIPAFTDDGKKDGQLRRQCTSRWKITPIRKFTQSIRGKEQVEQWMGISVDEAGRAGSSDVKYITHRYPLLEKRMTRNDCIQWLQRHDLPVPDKSSCVFCPYHNKAAWQDLKRNPADWAIAVAVDEQIRDVRPPFDLFVHPSRKPLSEAVMLPEDFGYEQIPLLELRLEVAALYKEMENFGDKQISLLEQECGSGYCFV